MTPSKRGIYLFGLEASEAEHSDLIGDVAPGSGVAGGLDARAQLVAHRDDAVRHQLHVGKPGHSTHTYIHACP